MFDDAHPDFTSLAAGWDLALHADGYPPNTVSTYRTALRRFASWLQLSYPGVSPVDVQREHLRAWLAEMHASTAKRSASTRYAGVRHFYRWLLDEGETTVNVTEGVRAPAVGEPFTPVMANDDVKTLLAACAGNGFVARRDTAVLMVLVDGGLRLAELAGLALKDVDLQRRVLFVEGKGTNRSGPRRRAVPLGIKASRTLDRYIRERRKHPWAAADLLWLGAQGRGPMTRKGMATLITRIGERAGVRIHPHLFRHKWASEFRRAGGEEGDLMVLGGWRSRATMDRYGKAAAGDRAVEAYRRRSLGDRL